MARLSHPNVVSVFDAGESKGRLFVAMELVSGRTLKDWLDQEPRGWRAAVDVMIQAGRGLAAAHAAGVVHRDVKPANILVDEAGAARVTDFGLARSLGVSEGEPASREDDRATAGGDGGGSSGGRVALDSSLTVPGSILGTPAYMAPEQRAGRADARSGQYAFCVTLHEAIYGKRPDRADDGTLRVKRAEVGLPRAIARVMERGLRVDLAARFDSMDALVEALVEARSLTRRRLTGAAAALALVAIGAGAFALSRREPAPPLCQGSEARIAEVWNAETAEALRASFRKSGRPGADATAARTVEILGARAREWAALHREVCAATRIRGEQSEALMDLRMACLDRRRREVGELATILSVHVDPSTVDGALQAAHALGPLERCSDTEALLAVVPPPADEGVREEVARLQARLDRVRVLTFAGRYREGLGLAEELAAAASELGHAPVEGEALALLGNLQARTGDPEAGAATLREAVVASARGRDDLNAAAAARQLVYVVGNLLGRCSEALELCNLAGAMVARSGGDPDQVADLLTLRALMIFRAGRFDEARPIAERALAIREESFGPDFPDLGLSLNILGLILREQGDLEGALRILERGLELWQRVLGQEHPKVAQALNNVGRVLALQGDCEGATRAYEGSIRIFEDALGEDHPDLAYPLTGIAECMISNGAAADAVPQLERALELVGPDADPEVVPRARFALARALRASGSDQGLASSLARQARAAWVAEGPHRQGLVDEVDAWLEAAPAASPR